jgi:hypothetical protein
VQHQNHFADDGQALWRDLEPGIKCLDELGAYILAGMLVHVVVGAHEDFLILRGPGAIFVFGAVDTGPVALMFLPCGEAVGEIIGDRFSMAMGWRARGGICSTGGAGPRWDRAGWLKGGVHALWWWWWRSGGGVGGVDEGKIGGRGQTRRAHANADVAVGDEMTSNQQVPI